MLLYASNGRLEGWASLDVGGLVELLKWSSASSLEAAPMWVSPTQVWMMGVVCAPAVSEARVRCAYDRWI
jgi:hypothetical protein